MKSPSNDLQVFCGDIHRYGNFCLYYELLKGVANCPLSRIFKKVERELFRSPGSNSKTEDVTHCISHLSRLPSSTLACRCLYLSLPPRDPSRPLPGNGMKTIEYIPYIKQSGELIPLTHSLLVTLFPSVSPLSPWNP